MEDKTFKRGQIIRYNDGRIGHCNVEATVLWADANSMIVQFHDRADTTTIRFCDRKWMDYLS